MNNIYETKNAIIESVRFDTERGLTIWVYLDYGGSGQGFGGYNVYSDLDQPNYCGHFVKRLLDVVGVNSWDDLLGKSVRVECNNGHVRSIGNIIQDNWFNPSEDFEKVRKSRDPIAQ